MPSVVSNINEHYKNKIRSGNLYGIKFNPKVEIKDDTISFSLLYKILKAKLLYKKI